MNREKVKVVRTCPKCGCDTWYIRSAKGGIYECVSCGKLWGEAFGKTEPANPWRDMKTDPPEARETVLALCKDGGQFVGFYTGNEDAPSWCIWTAKKSTKFVTRAVTHWMPLPKGE